MGDNAKNESKPKTSFFKGLEMEFKEISWPDKNTLLKQSVAVTVVSIILGGIIAVLDFAIQYGVNFLTK